MSEISPDIKLEDLNFIKDKVIESKEDPSFDLVSELRLKSEQPSTTTDSLKFRTVCSLLADLIDLNWSIEITRKGFDISPPKYIKSDEAKIRARESNQKAAETDISNLQDANFLKKLRNPPVGSKLKSIDALIDDGKELKNLFEKINIIKSEDKKIEELKKIIKPEIQHCFLDETCEHSGIRLMDIWKYFRLTWSMPYQTSNARTMPFLVRNGARKNKPVIGIFQLVNPFFNNTGRNNFLKWDNYLSAVQEIKNKNLTVDELGNSFLKSIEKGLKETRYDDFNLEENQIKKPNNKIITNLTNLSEKYRSEEKEEEKTYYKKKIKIKTRLEANTSKSRSEEKMYLKKRSKRLSKLLFARMIFNECNLKKNPKRAITIMLQTNDGKRAMNIALEYMRQSIYSTQAADLNVCGAIAPYNEIIGGKLVTLLSTSRNVIEKYNENYKKEKSIISSAVAGRDLIKPSKLLFLTVSSLYDITSSQYNRLKLYKKDFPKLKSDLIWYEAGLTEGLGSYHISQNTSDLINELTAKVKKFKKQSISGKGPSHKIRKIIIGLRILNLKTDDIMMHNQRRRNYVFFHKKQKDMIKFLYGIKKIENFNHCSSEFAITEAWMKRWLVERIKRKETLDKLKSLNSQTVSSKFDKIVYKYSSDNDQNLNLFSNLSS